MLWTREAVRDLIERKFGVKLSLATVGRYLNRWGFTPQKPITRAYERQDALVKRWLDEDYPTIASDALQEGAEIHWGDEAGFRSDHQAGRTYGLRGKTPIIEKSGKRFSTNMISTVTNRGTLRFMLFDGSFTSSVFIDFLRRLTRDTRKKVYLIVDNHRVHHSKKVRQWLEKNENQVKVFYLPAYSPELNPDELLNQDVKANASKNKAPSSLQELKHNLRSYLLKTQNSPKIIQNYFSKDSVAYAA